MQFELFLDLSDLDYYGNIPEIPDPLKGRVEIQRFTNDGDLTLLLNDIDELDGYCDALLDNGDVDFFDASKCAKLKEWIDERLQKPTVPRYREILEVLRDYCRRAVELNTGVVIDL